MILVDSFDLKSFEDFVCPICFEPTSVMLGEKWQVCSQFHFIKTKTICPTDPTSPIPASLPHPNQ
jgi:hypothetical protein